MLANQSSFAFTNDWEKITKSQMKWYRIKGIMFLINKDKQLKITPNKNVSISCPIIPASGSPQEYSLNVVMKKV